MSISHRDILANPSVPLERAHGIVFYTELANKTTKDIIDSFIPHPLTPAEIEEVHQMTIGAIAQVRRLEIMYDRVQRPHPIEANLFVARIQYRTIFCRAFRINDLPDEVLTDIFRFTVWTGPSPAVSNNWRLWLTWSCRKWRKMVIEDATIWNAIWFRDRYPFVRSWVWFDRSCSTPLDIRITDSVEDPYDGTMMKEMLDRIFTKIRQLRLFIVIVDAWEPALVALDWLQKIAKLGSPMILDRFEVHRTGPNYMRIEDDLQLREYHQPIPLFGGVHLPSFKSFSLNGIHINWHKTQISNLTTLDLRRMPLTRAPDLSIFRNLLRTSPNLYRLCLDGAGPKWQVEEGVTLDPIDLPNLKRLICANFSFEYAMFILRQLNASNVRDLHLFNFVGEDYTPLFEFMTGRCDEVRILTIYAVEMTPSPIVVGWLASMSKLMYLRVGHMQPFFLGLFLSRSAPVILPGGHAQLAIAVCPELCFLELNNGVDAVQALAWIVERAQMGHPIERLYITKALSSNLTEADHARFMQVAKVHRLEIGATPPEEEWILSL